MVENRSWEISRVTDRLGLFSKKRKKKSQPHLVWEADAEFAAGPTSEPAARKRNLAHGFLHRELPPQRVRESTRVSFSTEKSNSLPFSQRHLNYTEIYSSYVMRGYWNRIDFFFIIISPFFRTSELGGGWKESQKKKTLDVLSRSSIFFFFFQMALFSFFLFSFNFPFFKNIFLISVLKITTQ